MKHAPLLSSSTTLVKHAYAPLIILDFDETIADVDSSEWVAAQLGAAPLFDSLRAHGMPWHPAFNAVLASSHAHGTTIAHIREALCRLPISADTIAALKAAHALGCELRILSDANTFFINTVLEHHGLAALFSHVHSNPASVDAEGRLSYSSFHSDALPPHGCPLCPTNMCKGSVLSSIRASCGDPESLKIIYGGDGSGDLCPSLRLSTQDCVLPRQDYPLAKLLPKYHVNARMHPWTSLAAALQESLQVYVAPRKEQQAGVLCAAAALPQLARVKVM